MLNLMKPAWAVAFSKENNLLAWRKGGFGADGITMAPLWKQLLKEGGAGVAKRALTQAEKRKVNDQISIQYLPTTSLVATA